MATSSASRLSFENILRQYVGEDNIKFQALKRRTNPKRARVMCAAQDLAIRRQVNDQLEDRWRDNAPKDAAPLTIVGGGIHGTIAALAATDEVQVIERGKMGGSFWTQGPSFYLNSRNRPPRDGENLPGYRGALNFLPDGFLQPSDVSGEEYQTNDDLATAIRWNLARVEGNVIYEDVDRVYENGLDLRLLLNGSGEYIDTERVILATGLGSHKFIGRTISSYQFMRRMAIKDFPLKDLRRVAVIGAKDSGNTVVEALMGQGPSQGMSVAGLDWIEQVDWYGQDVMDRFEFEQCARSRYAGLARYFPNGDDYYRIQPKPRAVGVIREGDKRVVMYRDGVGQTRYGGPYDLVINATGYVQDDSFLDPLGVDEWENVIGSDGEVIGLKLRGFEIYKVGPAANLPVSERESFETPVLTDPRTDNAVAIFRYAPRTAELARRITA